MLYVNREKKTSYQDAIILVPDDRLKQSLIYPKFFGVKLNNKSYRHEVYITPHYDENFINTDILKFRIFCDQYNIKITSFGSKNQFPFFSIFSDEVFLAENDQQTWYNNQWSRNYNDVTRIKKSPKYLDIEKKEMQSFFRRVIPDSAVVDRFTSRRVHILKSTYDIFEQLVAEQKLTYDQVICESKVGSTFFRDVVRRQRFLRVAGIDQDLQMKMVEWTTPNHYMGCQILCSNMLNWRYLCCGGCSNLFSVIPMRSLCLAEQLLNESTMNILRSMSIRRYGKIGRHMPLLSSFKYNTQWIADEINKKMHLVKKFSDILSCEKKPIFPTFDTSCKEL